jgi:hypothetical protein
MRKKYVVPEIGECLLAIFAGNRDQAQYFVRQVGLRLQDFIYVDGWSSLLGKGFVHVFVYGTVYDRPFDIQQTVWREMRINPYISYEHIKEDEFDEVREILRNEVGRL